MALADLKLSENQASMSSPRPTERLHPFGWCSTLCPRPKIKSSMKNCRNETFNGKSRKPLRSNFQPVFIFKVWIFLLAWYISMSQDVTKLVGQLGLEPVVCFTTFSRTIEMATFGFLPSNELTASETQTAQLSCGLKLDDLTKKGLNKNIPAEAIPAHENVENQYAATATDKF